MSRRGSELSKSADACFTAHHQSSQVGGRKQVKKLLITTAALTLGLSTATNLVSESQAASTGKAPTKSAYCDLAKSQRNPVSWNARYNCLASRWFWCEKELAVNKTGDPRLWIATVLATDCVRYVAHI